MKAPKIMGGLPTKGTWDYVFGHPKYGKKIVHLNISKEMRGGNNTQAMLDDSARQEIVSRFPKTTEDDWVLFDISTLAKNKR